MLALYGTAGISAVPTVDILAAPAVLGAVGFGVVDPAADAVTVACQSRIDTVQVGSFQARCQNLAMGGGIAGIAGVIGSIAAGVGAAAGLLGKGLSWL